MSMLKKTGIIIAGIVVVLLVLSGIKNFIIKAGVEKASEMVTGLKLDIGGLNVGILKTFAGIKELRLYNPKGFEDKLMVEAPEIYVDYDLPAILKGHVHLYDVRFNLKECTIIKNKDGKLNLDSLKSIQQAGAKEPSAKEAKGKPANFKIDQLELKIGRVVFKDYTTGSTPRVLTFNIDLDERYENITDPNALVNLIVLKVVTNTTIGKLINLDISGLKDTVGNTLESARHLTTQATSRAGEALGAAGKTLTDTAGNLTDKLKLPFGGK